MKKVCLFSSICMVRARRVVRRIECFHSRGQHLCKFIGTKESVYVRKEFNSHRASLGHQHGRRFIVLGHQYGRRDVMWKHSILLNCKLQVEKCKEIRWLKLMNRTTPSNYMKITKIVINTRCNRGTLIFTSQASASRIEWILYYWVLFECKPRCLIPQNAYVLYVILGVYGHSFRTLLDFLGYHRYFWVQCPFPTFSWPHILKHKA